MKKEIKVEKNYTFLPYSHTSEGVSPLHFYEDDCRDVSLRARVGMPPKALFLLVVVCPCIREPIQSSEGDEAIRRRSGLHCLLWHNVVCYIRDSESRFTDKGRDKILSDLPMFFRPSRGRDSFRSPGGALY